MASTGMGDKTSCSHSTREVCKEEADVSFRWGFFGRLQGGGGGGGAGGGGGGLASEGGQLSVMQRVRVPCQWNDRRRGR